MHTHRITEFLHIMTEKVFVRNTHWHVKVDFSPIQRDCRQGVNYSVFWAPFYRIKICRVY